MRGDIYLANLNPSRGRQAVLALLKEYYLKL
jgi:hypothetical protein